MKDSVEFHEEEKRESDSNWHIGISTPSFETMGSKVTLLQHNLRVLFKRETPSERRSIPATLYEKLSYYRSFATSPFKLQIMSMQQNFYNEYLWIYLGDLFLKFLPSTYIQIFLSSYAAEEHFFVSKMIPLFYGYIWYCTLSGFIAVNHFCGYVVILWDYVISGLLYKNPWNRCASYYNLTVVPTCYDVDEFTEKIKNETVLIDIHGYTTKSNPDEYIQMAPLLFLKSRMDSNLQLNEAEHSNFWIFETIVLVIACLFYKQLFKKYMWKILHYSQTCLMIIYFATFCHLIIYYFANGFRKMVELNDNTVDELLIRDFRWNRIADSLTSPPIVHILSSRGTEKIKPSRDSTKIIFSNAVYYIFRAVHASMMKRYCEHMIGTTLMLAGHNSCAFFFFWPIYFYYFYLGDYYTIIYFLLNGIEEFLLVAITLYCLIEAVSCEWHRIKPWCVAGIFSILHITVCAVNTIDDRILLYTHTTVLSSLVETFVIYCLYPLGRLLDDVTFHFGTPSTTLRIWNFRAVPVYYTLKTYTVLDSFTLIEMETMQAKLSPYIYFVLYLQPIPFVLGTFYAIYDIVYRKKQGWKQLLVPVPHWGPKDAAVRHLRHQYDSRQYIGSQAPRELSRYFMEKAELTTYQLDIQYESHYRQQDFQYEMRFEDEKKSN